MGKTKGRYINVPAEIAACKDLTSTEKLIISYLMSFKKAFSGYVKISEATGSSYPTVSRAIASLRKKRMIKSQRWKFNGPNTYTVLQPEAWEIDLKKEENIKVGRIKMNLPKPTKDQNDPYEKIEMILHPDQNDTSSRSKRSTIIRDTNSFTTKVIPTKGETGGVSILREPTTEDKRKVKREEYEQRKKQQLYSDLQTQFDGNRFLDTVVKTVERFVNEFGDWIPVDEFEKIFRSNMKGKRLRHLDKLLDGLHSMYQREMNEIEAKERRDRRDTESLGHYDYFGE